MTVSKITAATAVLVSSVFICFSSAFTIVQFIGIVDN